MSKGENYEVKRFALDERTNFGRFPRSTPLPRGSLGGSNDPNNMTIYTSYMSP